MQRSVHLQTKWTVTRTGGFWSSLKSSPSKLCLHLHGASQYVNNSALITSTNGSPQSLYLCNPWMQFPKMRMIMISTMSPGFLLPIFETLNLSNTRIWVSPKNPFPLKLLSLQSTPSNLMPPHPLSLGHFTFSNLNAFPLGMSATPANISN